MRVKEFWTRATTQLSRIGIPDPGIEAEVLLRHAMGVERAGFFAILRDQLVPRRRLLAESLLQRRLSGEPLAYITGLREFYGLEFCVRPSVLIPRQETELLVDKVLEFHRQKLSQGKLVLSEADVLKAGHRFARDEPQLPLVIADVGTGSGAIAVAIAKHLSTATVYATDSSREALLMADINRRRHAVTDRVHLRHGDLLEALQQPVDVMVANLPYLTTGEVASLPPNVRREPSHALDGGADGLDMIRRLLRQAPSYVRPGGLILVEIAPQQFGSVWLMGNEVFPSARVTFARDLLGLPRAVSISTRSTSSVRWSASRTGDRHSHPPTLPSEHLRITQKRVEHSVRRLSSDGRHVQGGVTRHPPSVQRSHAA